MRAAVEVRNMDAQQVEDAERQRLINTRLENLKFAVEARTNQINREMQYRHGREQVYRDCVDSLDTDAEKREAYQLYTEHEQQVHKASTKRWTWTTDDFEPIRKLGQGGFGVVHLVREKNAPDKYWALKQMQMGHFVKKNGGVKRRAGAYLERQILTEKANRWFVGLQCTFKDSQNVYMVMEFLQGGDLVFHLSERQRFSEKETQFYVAELLEALDVVHSFGYVHRDIKADNCCLAANGHLKLLDFGLVAEDAEQDEEGTQRATTGGMSLRDQKKSNCGTPQYQSPEVIERGEASPASDIWAMGILTFELLFGSVPFCAPLTASRMDQRRITEQQVKRHVEFLEKRLTKFKARGQAVSEVAESFVRQVLCKREVRLDLEDARQHPFFKGVDFARIHLAEPPIKPSFKSSCDASYFDDFGKTSSLPAGQPMPPEDGNFPFYEFDRNSHEISKPETLETELQASLQRQ